MIPITLHCFGPLQVTVDGHIQPKFATDRARALLVYLATAEPRAHRRDELATLFWPDRPDKTARQNLRTTLSRIRRAAGNYGGDLLLTDYKTVRLNHDLIQADTQQFETVLTTNAAHDHAELTDCAECITRLTVAIEQYGGNFLQGFHLADCQPFEEWLLLTRERWRQNVLQSLLTLAHFYEQQKNHPRVIVYARQLVALESWQEQVQRQLMRALAMSGQRTEAMAQYERYAAELATELAIQPDPETIQLYEAIRRNELTSAGDEKDKERDAIIFHHFPTDAVNFVGRVAEIEQISTYINDNDCRLVTVTGVGGIGKTRLIIQAALGLSPRQFPDGIYFISLASLSTEDEVLPQIAGCVGLAFSGSLPARQQLFAFLRVKQALLLLDNFEHLLDSAGLIAELLVAAKGVKCLVTSRMALQVQAEWRLSLAGLFCDETVASEAVTLFIDRAKQFNVSRLIGAEDIVLVNQICSAVQGVPLAIEMAAAWLRVYDLPTIAAEITQNLDFLISPMRDAPPRHRSMRAVFDGSWQLLPPHEQRVFARLSLFQGNFTQAAAQAIADASLLDLAWLLDKSLLQRLPGGRYAIHQLLRQFVAEKLDEMETKDESVRRFMTYYLALVTQDGTRLKTGQSRTALKQLQMDIDNVRQAWALAITAGAATLLHESRAAVADYFLLSGLYDDGIRFFAPETVHADLVACWQLTQARFLVELGRYGEAESICLPLLNDDDPAVVVVAHLILTYVLFNRRRIDEMEPRINQAEALAQEHGLAVLLAECETRRGLWLLETGQPLVAETMLLRARAHYREQNNVWGETIVLKHLASAAAMCHRDVRPIFIEMLGLQRQIGSRAIQRETLNSLGLGMMFRGNFGEAKVYFQEALEICEQIGNRSGRAATHVSLGRVHHRLGDFGRARQFYEQAQCAFSELDDAGNESLALIYLGLLACHEASFAQALAFCQRARQRLAGSRYLLFISLADWCAGHAYAGLEDWATAQQYYETALASQKGLQRSGRAMATQAALADVLQARGQAEQALTLVEEVLAYLPTTEIHKSDDPFRLHLACYRVLVAHGDARALPLMQAVYEQLQMQAAQIETDEARDRFWKRMPVYAEIETCVERQNS